MSLSSPVRNTVLPLRIQERLNQMFARATGFSGPQVLDFLRRAPKKGGTTSRERHGQFPVVPRFAPVGEPTLNVGHRPLADIRLNPRMHLWDAAYKFRFPTRLTPDSKLPTWRECALG